MLLRQFIKFGIVGLSNTALSYIIYAALVYVGTHYLIASVTAFMLSVLNSFFWNKKYVFKHKNNSNNSDSNNDDRDQHQYKNQPQRKRGFWGALIKTYISYAFTGLILSNILLYVFVGILHISEYIAPLLGLVITVPLNFVLNKRWAFKG